MLGRTPFLCLCVALLWGPAPGQEPPWTYRQLKLQGGGILEYAVVLPDGFDATRTYPVLLAFPPGSQDRTMVAAGLGRYWGSQARSRGWVVVSPVANKDGLFFRGGAKHVPALLRSLRILLRVEGNRFHLAGTSNGGLAAFRAALEQPFQFQSLTVLPGHVSGDGDLRRLGRLVGMKVRLHAGGDDARWLEASRRTLAALEKAGVDAKLTVHPGEGHVPSTLDGNPIMKALDAQRTRAPSNPGPVVRVAATLDDFHDAAAKADEKRYFGLFTPEGVFMGTDATERWTATAFKKWALPFFQRPSAWVFVPTTRNIMLDKSGKVAWFDEVVWSASYGECRGTGVLLEIDGAWKVAHYNLTVPVPNALLPSVVERIRDQAAKGEGK